MTQTKALLGIFTVIAGLWASSTVRLFAQTAPAQLFVLDFNWNSGGNIDKYDPAGGTLTRVISSLNITGGGTTQDLAYDGHGHVLVVSGNRMNNVSKFTTSGATVSAPLFTVQSGAIGSLAADENGDLYATYSGDLYAGSYVGKFSPSGATVNASLIALTNYIVALTADGNGYLYVADYSGNIGKYTTSGATVNASLLTVPSSNGILALAADAKGHLFVETGMANFNVIGEYTTSGETVNASLITVSTGYTVTTPVAVDGNGHLFVGTTDTNYLSTITEYTASGETVSAFSYSSESYMLGLVVVPPTSSGAGDSGTNVVCNLNLTLTGFQGTNTAKAVTLNNKGILSLLNGVLTNSLTGAAVTNHFVDEEGKLLNGAKLMAVFPTDSEGSAPSVIVRQVFSRTNIVDTDVSPWLWISQQPAVRNAKAGYAVAQVSLDNGNGVSFDVRGFGAFSKGDLVGTSGQAKGVRLSDQTKAATVSVAGTGYLPITVGTSDSYTVLKGSMVMAAAAVEVK